MTDKYDEDYKNEISYSFSKQEVLDPQTEDYVWQYGDVFKQGTPNSVAIQPGGFYYAAIHLHPKGTGITGGIFSWQDLRALEDLYNGAYYPYKKDVALMVLAPDPTDNNNSNIYSIRVNNLALLYTHLQYDWNNAGTPNSSDEKKTLAINDWLAEKYTAGASDLEKTFLEVFENYGISLFKLNNNQDSWDEIKLIHLGNQKIKTKKPCN